MVDAMVDAMGALKSATSIRLGLSIPTAVDREREKIENEGDRANGDVARRGWPRPGGAGESGGGHAFCSPRATVVHSTHVCGSVFVKERHLALRFSELGPPSGRRRFTLSWVGGLHPTFIYKLMIAFVWSSSRKTFSLGVMQIGLPSGERSFFSRFLGAC